eukprot:scaffold6847_cov64-Phaeocystis_antarctica.AAC.1
MRVPASCVPYVPEAQGSLPPHGSHALCVRRRRTSLGPAAVVLQLRDGRLHQPNHADADVLLRAWADPTVAALVPTISVNKVPREGGTFFLNLGHAEAGAGIQPDAGWLNFQPNGGPSLNFSAPGKRSRVEDDERVYRNAQCSNEGITRHGCSVTSKASAGGPPLPLLRIMKFQVAALPGHRTFPSGLSPPGGPRSSQCKEAKLVSGPAFQH